MSAHIYLYQLTRSTYIPLSSHYKIILYQNQGIIKVYLFSRTMDSKELTKSLDVKKPNFQKDVIMPQIYDLANIKLIQSCGFKDSPINKVADLKKRKIENVIKSIVTKQKVHAGNSVPLHESLNSKKDREKLKKRSHEKILSDIEGDTLFMEIDEQMGEMIALAQENFVPFSDRVKNALSKAKYKFQNKELEKRKEEAEFFIKVISEPKGKKADPDKIRSVPGLLEELKVMEKSGYSERVKPKRAQSAQVIRNNSSLKPSQLYKSNVWKSGQSSNLNQKNRSEVHLTKSRHIIRTIDQCLQDENQSNIITEIKMKEMRDEWNKNSQLGKTFARSLSSNITVSTLQILKDKRLKDQALSKLDKEYFNH